MASESRFNSTDLTRHFYVWTRRAGIFGANVAVWEILKETWIRASPAGADAGIPWGFVANAVIGFWIWFLLRDVELKYPATRSSQTQGST